MAVKPGYKQTELGIIPAEWKVSTVGQQFSVQLGKMLDAKTNVGVPKPYLGNRAVQWNRINIDGLSSILLTSADLQKFRLEQGDLLVCEGGEVGRAAIWDAPIEECYFQKALHRLRPIRGFDTRLMVAILHRWATNRMFADYVTQTSIAHLPRERFIKVPIPLPPRAEQRAIAAALIDVDALLDSLDRLIAKKSELKRTAMKQLLTGEMRLPGFNQTCETGALEHIADCLDHLRVPLNETQRANMPGPYPYCGANGILDYVDDFVIDDDVILIAEDGGYFDEFDYRPIAYRMSEKIWVNNHAHILKAKRVYNQGFLYFSLVHKNILPYLSGGTRAKLNKSEMNKIEIYLPLDCAEQKAIAAVLSDMDSEIAALEDRRKKTHDLKRAMMQELLTGKTRLVEPEATHA